MNGEARFGAGRGRGCGRGMEHVAFATRVLAREWGREFGRGARGRFAGGRFGGGPFGGFGGAGFGGWGGFRGGPRARRGDVRAALLVLLAEEPRNGYQLMQAIDERSRGLWRPSPGAVYPALQQLEDEGLIAVREEAGQRRFHLTEAGRQYVEGNRAGLGTPWEAAAESVGDDVHALFHLARQSGAALLQVAHTGDPRQVARAAEILTDTRRQLYRILAEEGDDGPGSPASGGEAKPAEPGTAG